MLGNGSYTMYTVQAHQIVYINKKAKQTRIV